MTMLKQSKTGIHSYMSDDRDVDELIFGTEGNSVEAEAPCSDR